MPVADECWMLFHTKRPEAIFFQKFGRQIPRNEWRPGKQTKQGMYAMTADGTYLGASKSGTRKGVAIRLMKSALKKWDQIVLQKGYTPKPIPGRVANRTWGDRADKAGLLIQANSRDLPRGTDLHPGKGWEKTAWNVEWLEYSRQEALSFIPQGAPTAKIPDGIVRKLVRKCLRDNVRGQTPEWRNNQIKKAWMNTETIQVKDGFITVRLQGEASCESGSHGYDCKLHGQAIFDTNTQKFIRFEMIAVGLSWGGTTFNFRRGDLAPAPLGISFTIEGQYDKSLPTACTVRPVAKQKTSSFSLLAAVKRELQAKKKAVAKRKEASPEAISARDAALRSRVTEAVKAGRRPRFYCSAFRSRARVMSLKEDGSLVLDCRGVELPTSWSKLALRDRRSLALSTLREGVETDHCLVAFYYLATGLADKAVSHLAKAGVCADVTRAAFR